MVFRVINTDVKIITFKCEIAKTRRAIKPLLQSAAHIAYDAPAIIKF